MTLKAEPVCPGKDGKLCDGTMVHNSWTEEWECASSFFALIDNEVLSDGFVIKDEADLDKWDLHYLEHWRACRVHDNEADVS